MPEHRHPAMLHLLLLSLLVATAHPAYSLPAASADDKVGSIRSLAGTVIRDGLLTLIINLRHAQAAGVSPPGSLLLPQQHPGNVTGHYKGEACLHVRGCMGLPAPHDCPAVRRRVHTSQHRVTFY